MAYKTLEQNREYQRRHYLKYKEHHLDRIKKRRVEIRLWINSYKQDKTCVRCGFDNPLALDFHHLYDKKYNLAEICNYGVSIETLKAEITKCELICANCHRIEHSDGSGTGTGT